MHFAFAGILLGLSLNPTRANPANFGARQNCEGDYVRCQPGGANSRSIPATGHDLAPLYSDLLASIKGLPAREEQAFQERDAVALCCVIGTACLSLHGFDVPFCYDRFTTNFKLASGAYGSLDSGRYNGPDGSSANLLTGEYTAADGSKGNIYGDSPPATANLAIPSPYTSAGVGSAIPITALGGYATYTVVIPGTTIAATTVAGATVSPIVLQGTTIATASSAAATTIPGTTVAAKTSIVTSLIVGGGSTSTGAAAAATMPTQAAGAAAAGLVVAALLL